MGASVGYDHLAHELETFLLQLEISDEASNPQSQESSMRHAILRVLASLQFHAPRVPSPYPPRLKRARVFRSSMTCGICMQPNHSEDICFYTHPNLRFEKWHPNAIIQQHIRDREHMTGGKELSRGGIGDKQEDRGREATTNLGCRGGRRTSSVNMLTRTKTRRALAELEQQQIQPAATFTKPLPSRDPDSVSVAGLSIISKKMNVISLDSSEEHDVSHSESIAIDLSESSKSVVEISSSDEDSGDDDLSSEDEDEDVDESDDSEDVNHGKRKSSSAPLASKLQVAEVAKLSKGGDPKQLKVDDCRAYLRNYGLRISGTKPELIGRIKQHIELQEGGSRNYDRSTFTINCTGDVCKGDVVKFNQKVNDKGSRTVAGRVVKESYGAQRQQHTFTVEVLWSTGYSPLAPMKQLLVKGRNLYKRKTHRQKWADEGDRARTLAEKHERGDAARQVRAMKQGRSRENGGKFEPEGLSMKPLANPYTDTLASGILFQPEVSGRYNAPVWAQQHSLQFQSEVSGRYNSPFRAQQHSLQFQSEVSGRYNSPFRAQQHSLQFQSEVFGRYNAPFRAQQHSLQFQSEVSGRYNAPARAQQHSPHRQTSCVPTGANSIPLGKIRQVWRPRENVDINPASKDAPNPTGANTSQLGRIQQFGQRSENVEIEVASGGVSTSTDATQLGDISQIWKDAKFAVAAGSPSVSVSKHKQCVKPSPVLLPSGQGCEAQNVENCSTGNYNSTELKWSLEKPSVWGNDVSKMGFPCPTHSCTYRGSRLCSTGVCYYCCKKKGGVCYNPNHRPQAR